MQQPAQLLFLYGAPAVGKLTIAREISELAGLPVFHNHLVVDAVSSVFPFGSAPFIRLREMMWLEMFREAAAEKRSAPHCRRDRAETARPPAISGGPFRL